MPIAGIPQPDVIQIEEGLRLRRFEEICQQALQWYQDCEMVYLVDGVREPYSPEKLERMYTYLAKQGELYWIEVEEQGTYRPVGDVTFWQEDMPIVIGDAACRGKGLGRKVITALVQRGRALGYDKLRVAEIYRWNEISRRCFESAGFSREKETENGSSYVLAL